MFTGIVEEAGRVLSFEEGPQSWKLRVQASTVLEDLAVGDSLAVNGCCLTVVSHGHGTADFDLLGETVRLTSFAALRPGARINLERSLRFNGKVGGHFVSGHIDGLGRVTRFEPRGKDYYLRIAPPSDLAKYLVYKGSIAVDGVSLTVAEADADGFAVWLIPHTLEVTNFGDLRCGSLVNLEFDLLAKYVEKLLLGGREIERSAP